jgi:hypothetical protein
VYDETVSCVINDAFGHEPECIGSGEFTAWGDSLTGTKDVHNGEGDTDHQREEPMEERHMLGLCYSGLLRE